MVAAPVQPYIIIENKNEAVSTPCIKILFIFPMLIYSGRRVGRLNALTALISQSQSYTRKAINTCVGNVNLELLLPHSSTSRAI